MGPREIDYTVVAACVLHDFYKSNDTEDLDDGEVTGDGQKN
jgi:hypothetical protein